MKSARWKSPSGARVKAHRLSLKMDQARYGRMLLVSRQATVSQWERDEEEMEPVRWKLAVILGKQILSRRKRRLARGGAHAKAKRSPSD
jgi:DNA-binding transcriptional regulator YiaG